MVAIGLWLVWSAARPLPPSPTTQACDTAIIVDGQLRCDDEVPARVDALCPASAPVASENPRGGDVFDTARLCARGQLDDAPSRGRSRMAPDDLVALGQPVDINRASPEELTSLPRIGPVLARRIVEGRPYARLEDLLRVRGIGPATLRRLRSRASFGPG